MKDLVIVFARKKERYAPIADAIVKASNSMGFDIKFYGDDLRGYKNIIIFDNRMKRVKKLILCDDNAKVGWWMNDLRPPKYLSGSKISEQITHIFLCNIEYLDKYARRFNKEAYYMPQAGHELYNKYGRTIDENIVFIGSILNQNYHYNRKAYIKYLQPLGSKHIYGERTSYDMDYVYRNTPISLSISLPVEGYTSNRTYNILASKGFALVLYYPGLEKQFKNGEHLVWFQNKEEAYALAEYYINHKEDRDRIAQNGYNIFVRKHRVNHRIQNMYDILKGKTNKFYGYNI